MKNFMSLRILDKFKWIFIKMGVNYEVMRKILQIKLTLDTRRQTVQSSMQNKKNENKERNYFAASLVGYLITGIFIALVMVSPLPLMYRYSVCLGITIFMIAMSMISDFSTVLLDLKEKQLLGSKPINDKTVNAARFIHIFIYLSMITVVFAGPMTIVSFFKDGVVVGLIFILDLIIADIAIILFTGLFYFVFLRFFSGEKLKDIINYVQIVMSITVVIGYQFLGRVFEFVDTEVLFSFKWWQFFLPSIVFSAPINIVSGGEVNSISIFFSIWTLILPIIAVVIYSKILVPHFENSLYKMTTIENKKEKKIKTSKKNSSGLVARIFCRDSQERAVFEFTTNMFRRDRKFKQSIYPSMAMAFIFPFIFMLNSLRGVGIQAFLANFYENSRHLMGYVGIMMMTPMVVMLSYSEKYKGAWIYDVLPIQNKNIVKKGAFKSFIVKFFYTIFLAYTVVFTAIGGVKVLPDMFGMFMALNAISLFCYRKLFEDMPFSNGYTTNNAKSFGNTLTKMLLVGVIMGVHYLSKKIPYGNGIFIIAIGVLTVVYWFMVFGTRENKREEDNNGQWRMEN
ncbi:hypothetical protein [Oceanirhabdus sp. W0125-5]|uniref:hypothetical protein n=1 Tax=Oceanirhabdus sp. W0125-5 TaxID=2999116 RepID=UPI0022F2E977|nr:hypothetical protein [Oceanirhabdus sp. W0125-5]WBW99177.1 hypothetical protein OW730_10640 [Oceanirhabdus sp. W0125-5]